MSVVAIKNQPIQFDVVNDACVCDSLSYKQLVDTNDVSLVQFSILPCLWNENLVTAGGFTDATAWTVTDSFEVDETTNLACKESGGIGTLSQFGVFNAGGFYYVEIIVDSINEIMQVWNGGTRIGTIDGVGRFVFSFQATSDSISIRSFSSTNEACLSSISAYEIDSRLLVAILDENNAYIAGITLADNSEYFTFAKGTLTVAIDWNALGVSAGCYTIGIADPCINTNGQNGNQDPLLLNESIWTISAGVDVTYEFNTGELVYSAVDFAPDGLLTLEDQNVELTAGISYDIEIDISAGDGSVQVYGWAGSASDNTVCGTGTITFTIVAAGATPYFKFGFQPNSVATSRTVITRAEIKLTNLSDISPDSESVALKVGTFDCSVMFNANCNEDALGFEFETSLFNPRLRLEAELINPTYITNRNTIEDTNGNIRILYGERKKALQVILGMIPEYILDYVSLLPIFDNLWIDGELYSVQEDGIEIEYPNGVANYGRVVLNVIQQSNLLTNTNISGKQNNANFAVDSYIVDPNDDELIITEPSTGDTLKAL